MDINPTNITIDRHAQGGVYVMFLKGTSDKVHFWQFLKMT